MGECLLPLIPQLQISGLRWELVSIWDIHEVKAVNSWRGWATPNPNPPPPQRPVEEEQGPLRVWVPLAQNVACADSWDP